MTSDPQGGARTQDTPECEDIIITVLGDVVSRLQLTVSVIKL